MSSNLYVLGASALTAVTLVACGGEPKQAGPANPSGEVDVTQLLNVLPSEIVTSYDDVAYNERTGETVISNLRFSSEEDTDVGVIIETLSVTGVNTDFLLARLNGTNFDEESIVVDQLEASKISLFGVEKFYGDFFETYNEKVEEVVDGLVDDDELEDAFSPTEIEKLNFQIETISLDDFELRPFLLNKRELEDETDSEVLGFFQAYAAYNRSIGAQRMSIDGLKLDMAMRDADGLMNMTFNVPSSIVEGWHGGDIDKSVVDSMTFNANVPIPEEDRDGELPFESISMAGDYGLQMVEGLRLDKALSWLARGEMPPTTETDLMSLGVWTAKDQSFLMFDKPFFSLESSVTDMSQFHWLIPTQIKSENENIVYDIGGLMEFVSSFVPEDDEGAEDLEMVTKVLGVLKDYDLSAPSMDIDFNWLWDAQAGASALTMETGLDGYGTTNFDISGIVGGFDDWVATVEAARTQENDGDAFEAFAAERFAFNGASFKMDDRGGNDRIYDAVVAVAQVLKDTSPEAAAIAAYDKETLKILVSSGLRAGAATISEEFPFVVEYVGMLADYMTKGGTFAVALEPDTPLNMETLAGLEQAESPADIEALLDTLGFSVTYNEPN